MVRYVPKNALFLGIVRQGHCQVIDEKLWLGHTGEENTKQLPENTTTKHVGTRLQTENVTVVLESTWKGLLQIDGSE